MTDTRAIGDGDTADLVAIVRDRIARGLPVRRRPAGGGRLHIDRPLPFLCVHRAASVRDHAADLVRSQASYLVATSAPARQPDVARLVAGVVDALAGACGACLLLELWTTPDPPPPVPRIRIVTPAGDRLATTVGVLADALRAMVLPLGPLEVDLLAGDGSPPGAPPLLAPEVATHAGVLVIGLEVPPIYRSNDRHYPLVLRALARELGRALQQGFFEFARVQTAARPDHYQAMGRRRMVRTVREADRALVEIEASFDFLLDVTPVNTEEAWREFCASGRARAPALRYRMLAVDPELGKRRLYELPLERLEDPVLALLLRDKRRELDRQLGLLEDRDSPRFLPGSIALHGGVEDALLTEAEAILAATAAASPPSGPAVDAAGLAARARDEIDAYRAVRPTLAATVALRDDVPSLIVSHGDLLVPRTLSVPAHRVDALLQHEVGTHVVTHANGASQPLRVLSGGLAGYEALQEGLGIFAEYLVGGLDIGRLRLIAARVVAVRRMIDGATLPDVVAELAERHRFGARTAFGVAIRVFRGGGLTKDAIYLRGLIQLLDHLAGGGALEPILIGKIALAHVPIIEELLRRHVLHPAPLRPRWLDAPGADDRLARARTGLRPLELLS